jgi:glutathione S-transferase
MAPPRHCPVSRSHRTVAVLWVASRGDHFARQLKSSAQRHSFIHGHNLTLTDAYAGPTPELSAYLFFLREKYRRVKRFDSPYLPSFPSDKDFPATPSDKDASDFPPNGPIAIELRIERGFSVSGTQQTRF